jgi:hypothetical protein
MPDIATDIVAYRRSGIPMRQSATADYEAARERQREIKRRADDVIALHRSARADYEARQREIKCQRNEPIRPSRRAIRDAHFRPGFKHRAEQVRA